MRIDYKLGRLWLLLDPRIFREIPADATNEQIEESNEFVRSRLTARFNLKANAMLSGWVRTIFGSEKKKVVELHSFSISNGVDATFEVCTTTGFSGEL